SIKVWYCVRCRLRSSTIDHRPRPSRSPWRLPLRMCLPIEDFGIVRIGGFRRRWQERFADFLAVDWTFGRTNRRPGLFEHWFGRRIVGFDARKRDGSVLRRHGARLQRYANPFFERAIGGAIDSFKGWLGHVAMNTDRLDQQRARRGAFGLHLA